MKLVVFGLAAVALLFAVALGLGLRDDDDAPDPSVSRLSVLDELFPPRTLTADDARRANAPCVEGNAFVLATTCSFVVPDGVRRVALRRVGGPRLIATLDPGGGRVVQKIDTAKAGPNDDDPNAYRLVPIDDGNVLTLTCPLAAGCAIAIDGS